MFDYLYLLGDLPLRSLVVEHTDQAGYLGWLPTSALLFSMEASGERRA
jgi:hypothetical protein